MQKIIASRFPAKCKKCGGSIAAGERVYWLGNKQGVRHIHECVKSEMPTPSKVSSDDYSFTMKFTELRETYKRFATGDFSQLKRESRNLRTAEGVLSSWKDMERWTGCTIPEMSDWLDRGFIVDGLAGVDSSLFPAKPRRKLQYSEDGDELLLDLAWSGVDEHFIEWEKRDRNPGLKVEIECAFSASVDIETVSKYQVWLARMLQSLDEAAIDCEIDITYRGRSCYPDDPYGKVSSHKVRVKESGEASDFAAWSAMFSPGGFRGLTFAAILTAADFHGKYVDSGLGTPVTESDFNVSYDPDSNTLRVVNGNRAGFPEFEMTEKFKAVLDSISG